MEGVPSIDVSNVLSEEKRQQVIALGRLGWPLRRIQQETGIRRETAGAYLKAAGIAIRAPGGWGRRAPAKPAIHDRYLSRTNGVVLGILPTETCELDDSEQDARPLHPCR